MIKHFPKFKGNNPAGLRSFKFVHIGHIAQFPVIKNGQTLGAVQLIPGKNWLEGYSTLYTLLFTELPKTTANGLFYTQTLTGVAPTDQLELVDLMQSMEGQEFVVLVEDATGKTRLLGGYGYPLTFLADFSSGSNRSEAKGFEFEFSGRSEFRAPIYGV